MSIKTAITNNANNNNYAIVLFDNSDAPSVVATTCAHVDEAFGVKRVIDSKLEELYEVEFWDWLDSQSMGRV